MVEHGDRDGGPARAAPIEAHDTAVDTGGGRVDDAEPTADAPLVTAVVTTYDRLERAKRAIRSVLGQTYEPLEVLVVEDGTDSGVEEWLAAAGLEDVRYVRHATNQGLAGARNTAIALASAEYVAFLDDDDAWKPRRVERQIEQLHALSDTDRAALGVVYCAAERRVDGRVASILVPENEGSLRAAIERRGPSTIESSCLFWRAALCDVGGFDEALQSSIDHDVWLSLAAGGYAALAVEEPLVVTYDDGAASMMTDTDARVAGVRQFVEKWRPTYHEWFGPEAGERRIQRYFARVIARLAATKLVYGQWGEARTAIRAIVAESDQTAYNAFVLSTLVVELGVKRAFPPSVVRRLARLRR